MTLLVLGRGFYVTLKHWVTDFGGDAEDDRKPVQSWLIQLLEKDENEWFGLPWTVNKSCMYHSRLNKLE